MFLSLQIYSYLMILLNVRTALFLRNRGHLKAHRLFPFSWLRLERNSIHILHLDLVIIVDRPISSIILLSY